MNSPIYLDYASTTPLDPRVLDAMLPYMQGPIGNPHNRQHAAGRAAAAAIETARAEIAQLIGAKPGAILFTSGATEANNLAILGIARSNQARGRHVITVETEHRSVLEPCRRLAAEGFAVTDLPVEPSGLLSLGRLRAALRPETRLVSVMAVNNEIGTIQPIAEIAALCRASGALFHSDAAQAAGTIPLDVGRDGIDLMTISAHKIYGPAGIGALYVSDRAASMLEPILVGGGQERGLRPGTLPTALCVGFGAAARLVQAERDEDMARLRLLRDELWARLRAAIPAIRRNGDLAQATANLLNVAFAGVDGTDLMDGLDSIAVASAAACGSENGRPSHVLRALGLDDRLAHASIRISLGRFTDAAEIEATAGVIIAGTAA